MHYGSREKNPDHQPLTHGTATEENMAPQSYTVTDMKWQQTTLRPYQHIISVPPMLTTLPGLLAYFVFLMLFGELPNMTLKHHQRIFFVHVYMWEARENENQHKSHHCAMIQVLKYQVWWWSTHLKYPAASLFGWQSHNAWINVPESCELCMENSGWHTVGKKKLRAFQQWAVYSTSVNKKFVKKS